MKQLTILIDMDDVLWDLVGGWVEELNRVHGTNVAVSDVTDWKIKKFFPNLTDEQLYAPLFDPVLWTKLVPIPSAIEIVSRLINDGHRVRIVTATHYGTVSPKIKSFLYKYSFLKWEDIIIASDKSIIKGDVMIDDGVHNLIDFPGTRILFDRPHNHTFPAEANNMIRVQTWNEIYQIITKMAGGV